MTTYHFPQTNPAPKAAQNEIYLVASGDLRLSAIDVHLCGHVNVG